MPMQEGPAYVDEVGAIDGIVLEAKRVAVELCTKGDLSHVPSATFMGAAQRYMIVAASWLQGVLFRARDAYLENQGAAVDARVLKRVLKGFAEAGERAYNGGFSSAWIASERGIQGADAMSRLMTEAGGELNRLSALAIRSCVDWMLRTTSCGFIPQEVGGSLELYGRLITNYEMFADDMAVRLPFCRLRPPNAVGMEEVPPPPSRPCDVFISYRRIDGDVCARLLNQEFEHRGLRCFIDVERIGNGEYNPQILASLAHAENFVFVMTEMALQGLDDPEDPVRIELEAARRFGRRITIVAAPRVPRDITYLRLPPELEYLKEQNVYRLDVGEFFDASIEKIVTLGLGREI